MGWADTEGKGSGGKFDDVVKFAPNTTKLVHILLDSGEEPISYWTHYIPLTGGKRKGVVIICPGMDICPACKIKTYRTKRVHAMNVYDYETKTVKIMEQGNQLMQQLKAILDQFGSFDNIDISIRRIGEGTQTQYLAVPVPRPAPFDKAMVSQSKHDIAAKKTKTPVSEIAEYVGGGIPIQVPVEYIPDVQIPHSIPETNMIGDPILQFGKYKGMPLSQVAETDMNYVKWCADNISDPKIQKAAKELSVAPRIASKSILSDETEKILMIQMIQEIITMDKRYTDNYQLVIEKMKEATKSVTHPNGKTIFTEYTTKELAKLSELLK